MPALGGSQTCAAQIYGFTFTTIAKGAFLIRASIIFTPILCTIAGEAVPVGLWVGALTGFAGSIMISLDPSKADGAAASAAAGASHMRSDCMQTLNEGGSTIFRKHCA